MSSAVARVALAYALAKPWVTSVIIGARTEAQLDDNLEAGKVKLSADELAKLAGEKSENLFNLKVRRAAGSLESSADIQSTRRDLARVKTVLGEKQKAAKA